MTSVEWPPNGVDGRNRRRLILRSINVPLTSAHEGEELLDTHESVFPVVPEVRDSELPTRSTSRDSRFDLVVESSKD